MLFWGIFVIICDIQLLQACLFHRFLDVKTDDLTVLVSYLMADAGPTCEGLCIRNSDRCHAANVVPQPNGTYLCEFVTEWTSGEGVEQLLPNPGGRYVSRTTGNILRILVHITYYNIVKKLKFLELYQTLIF